MKTTSHLLPRIINPQGEMPIGVSCFKELIEDEYAFFDKSLFIKEIIDTKNKVMLITRPRRFGKTLNMSMLHRFLSETPRDQDIFNGLAIQEVGKEYQQERGKRPVLFLSFKDIKVNKWEGAFKKVRTLLSNLIDPLLDKHVEKLKSADRRMLDEVHGEQASATDCMDTLAILTELLTLQYGEKPWVLIDEYDTPMQTAYQYGFYDPMRNLMQGLLSQSFKDNKFLHRAVLTGILRMSKEDIFSGLNNFKAYGVLDDKFSQHFGFTPQEVDTLLEKKNLSEKKASIRKWYNGYNFGHTTIYNPWSIINFLEDEGQEPKLYWVNTGNSHLIDKLLAKADTRIKQNFW